MDPTLWHQTDLEVFGHINPNFQVNQIYTKEESQHRRMCDSCFPGKPQSSKVPFILKMEPSGTERRLSG